MAQAARASADLSAPDATSSDDAANAPQSTDASADPQGTDDDEDGAASGDDEAELAGPEIPEDIAALSYEEARDQLMDVVAKLERGNVTLEESMRLWERGEALAARCESWLAGARERLAAARDAAHE